MQIVDKKFSSRAIIRFQQLMYSKFKIVMCTKVNNDCQYTNRVMYSMNTANSCPKNNYPTVQVRFKLHTCLEGLVGLMNCPSYKVGFPILSMHVPTKIHWKPNLLIMALRENANFVNSLVKMRPKIKLHEWYTSNLDFPIWFSVKQNVSKIYLVIW